MTSSRVLQQNVALPVTVEVACAFDQPVVVGVAGRRPADETRADQRAGTVQLPDIAFAMAGGCVLQQDVAPPVAVEIARACEHPVVIHIAGRRPTNGAGAGKRARTIRLPDIVIAMTDGCVLQQDVAVTVAVEVALRGCSHMNQLIGELQIFNVFNYIGSIKRRRDLETPVRVMNDSRGRISRMIDRCVDTSPAVDCVIACAAINGVVARATNDRIVTDQSTDCLGPGTADQGVRRSRTVKCQADRQLMGCVNKPILDRHLILIASQRQNIIVANLLGPDVKGGDAILENQPIRSSITQNNRVFS